MKNILLGIVLWNALLMYAQENIPREVDVYIHQKNLPNFERLCTPEYIHYQRHEQTKSFFEYCVNHHLSIKGEMYIREKSRAVLPVKVYNKNKLYVGKAYFYLIRHGDFWYIDGANFQDIGDDRSPLQKFNALFLEGRIRGFYHPRNLKPCPDIEKKAELLVKQLKKRNKNHHVKYVWDNEVLQDYIKINEPKFSTLEYVQNHCDTTLKLCAVILSYMEQQEKHYFTLYFQWVDKEFVLVEWDNRLPKLSKFLRENENSRP
ncbi:MAG: hypothetical protein NZ455_10120 [Bacteroidia bacterium]|nr:hypothetical protein [Bacteroidia bacterium]MDW8346157.1 hypothetical protein [Bacteroidia bacterium]